MTLTNYQLSNRQTIQKRIVIPYSITVANCSKIVKTKVITSMKSINWGSRIRKDQGWGVSQSWPRLKD